MRKAVMFLGLVGVLLTSPVKADWSFATDENPFEGDLHLAINVDSFGADAVAFRCRVGDKPHLDLLVATPDHIDKDVIEKANSLIVKIAVIVDDQPKADVIATLDVNERKDNTARAISEDPDVYDIAQKVAVAHRRVAIAITIFDKVAYQHVYDVDGSTKAVGKIVEDCKGVKATLNGYRVPVEPTSNLEARFEANDPTLSGYEYRKGQKLHDTKMRAEAISDH